MSEKKNYSKKKYWQNRMERIQLHKQINVQKLEKIVK